MHSCGCKMCGYCFVFVTAFRYKNKIYVLCIVWDVPVKCACEKLNKVHNFFMKAQYFSVCIL